MTDARSFDKIRISIASPDDIRTWSYGEVKKPETINYRTFKPERDGLFCERIFGPVKDWECHCGRYKKQKHKGTVCERCGVEVTRARVRRSRMGHIELASPVAHIWYLKALPSPLSLLLDIPARNLEKVIYFASYMVTRVDRLQINQELDAIKGALREVIEDMHRQHAEDIDRLRREHNQQVEEHRAAEGEQHWDDDQIQTKNNALERRVIQEENELNERIGEMQRALDGTGDAVSLDKLEKKQLITDDEWRGIEKLLREVSKKLGKDLTTLVQASMGGAAIRDLLKEIDLEQLRLELKTEASGAAGQARLKLIKRLEIVDSLIASRCRPEWMILEAVPVLPPELRPMVQLDGGRFATSDLNDLYRRIINRNNRLRKIVEIRAPESIINHEKRLLQEAVDALIDNGRRSRPVVGSNNRALKSLSDMLKGKEGRFRKNLLGKRVDYSGRSVIVVGPHLKLHQCGLPKEMALELFKPFVMKNLVDRGVATNVKQAKRMIERLSDAVWDSLDEVIREHPVLLNRAPTLHRLGIQAFEPKLVDGKAIQIHPLVCTAFNADFDGDQMAVHVPLSPLAQAEARLLMLSSQNLFSPASGHAIVAPTQDIVLGCYYLTMSSPDDSDNQVIGSTPLPIGTEVEWLPFRSVDEVITAWQDRRLRLHQCVKVRIERNGVREVVETTPGRLMFHQILPAPLQYSDEYLNRTMNKSELGALVVTCFERAGHEATVKLLDDVKDLGFRFAKLSGVTIAMTDMDSPPARADILKRTYAAVDRLRSRYDRGLIRIEDRKKQTVEAWTRAGAELGQAIVESTDHHNPLFVITDSGARGSHKQLSQLAGMRGLFADARGNLMEDLPITSNFHEGLTVFEYFVSTHGARKGMSDTALRTADAGYLTRRLVDAAQDVIVRIHDCQTQNGIYVRLKSQNNNIVESVAERLYGRIAMQDLDHPVTGDPLLQVGEMIGEEASQQVDRLLVITAGLTAARQTAECRKAYTAWKASGAASDLEALAASMAQHVPDNELTGEFSRLAGDGSANADMTGMAQLLDADDDRVQLWLEMVEAGVKVRSPFTCEHQRGVCSMCYGRDLATGRLAEIGTAVGIIAAESIGEPGTQLTMRTFHTGGVAGTHVAGGKQAFNARLNLLEELRHDYATLMVNRVPVEGDVQTEEKISSKQFRELMDTYISPAGSLPRVIDLFMATEALKGRAIMSEYEGVVRSIENRDLMRLVVLDVVLPVREHGAEVLDKRLAEDVYDNTEAEESAELAPILKAGEVVKAPQLELLLRMGVRQIKAREEVLVPARGNLKVAVGQHVMPGDALTEGLLQPRELLKLKGVSAVQEYLVQEIQKVYKQQGVDIHDKHMEIIVRQMLKKRRVIDPGDTRFLPGRIVDKFVFEAENLRVRQEGGREATAEWVLQSITESALTTDSFLSAASFERTTHVLTEAAVRGKMDDLVGLKENVIIGRLIPAGTGFKPYDRLEPYPLPEGEPVPDDAYNPALRMIDDDVSLPAGAFDTHHFGQDDGIADLVEDEDLHAEALPEGELAIETIAEPEDEAPVSSFTQED